MQVCCCFVDLFRCCIVALLLHCVVANRESRIKKLTERTESMRMLKREANDAKIQAKASEESLKRVVKR